MKSVKAEKQKDQGKKNFQITARDREILKWLARWSFVDAGQVMREWERRGEPMNKRMVWHRFQALRELGLVDHQRGWYGMPGVYFLTREGLDSVGYSGGIIGPKLAQFDHDSALIDLADWLLRQRPNYVLVTEREIRAEDSPNYYTKKIAPPRYSVERLGTGGRVTRFHPDLATIDPSGRVTIHELEHSRKTHKRLVELMSSYLRADNIGRIHYYAYPPVIRAVQSAADEVNQRAESRNRDKRIHVFHWPVEEAADPEQGE